MTLTRKPETYWLHVDNDGTEHQWSWDPNWLSIPALRVDVMRDLTGAWVEQTYTLHAGWKRRADTVFVVRPRGQGWQLYDADSDKYSVWRRRL
jgi:hypothetical protein